MDGIFDPWAWRSDMNAPDGPRPEMKAFRPRTILDNVPPMASDAMSAMGVSGPVAGDYANRFKGLADSIPPVSLLNLASGIGNEAHNGNYGTAAGLTGISGLMGLYARGLMPGNRDAGMAKMLERFEGLPSIAPQGKAMVSDLSNKIGVMQPMQVSRPDNNFMGAVRMKQPANVNNRRQFERVFGILDGGQ